MSCSSGQYRSQPPVVSTKRSNCCSKARQPSYATRAFRLNSRESPGAKKQSGRAKAYLRHGLRLAPTEYANQFLGAIYLLDGNTYAALKYWNRVHRPILNEIVFTPAPPLRPELLARIPAASAGQLLPKPGSHKQNGISTGSAFSPIQSSISRPHQTTNTIWPSARRCCHNRCRVSRAGYCRCSGAPVPASQPGLAEHQKRAIMLTSLWRWDPDKRRIAIKYRAPLTHGTYAIWTDFRDENWVLTAEARLALSTSRARPSAARLDSTSAAASNGHQASICHAKSSVHFSKG